MYMQSISEKFIAIRDVINLENWAINYISSNRTDPYLNSPISMPVLTDFLLLRLVHSVFYSASTFSLCKLICDGRKF